MPDLPIVRVHPADHAAVKEYYGARQMRENEHYRLVAGPERWPTIEHEPEPYDRFADIA